MAPSGAVTTVVMVFGPTASAMAPLALPEGTLTPLTLTVAVLSATVGVSVIEVTAFATLTV